MSLTRGESTMGPITLHISGMTCASCVRRVEKALLASPGVQSAEVNLAAETARIQLQHPQQLAEVSAAVERAGYPLATRARQLAIADMTCASCVRRVETALRAVPGVLEVQVNLASEQARVTMAEGAADGQLLQSLEQAGYASEWLDQQTDADSD